MLGGASLSADARWLRSARYGSSLEPSKPCSGERARWVGPYAAILLVTLGLGTTRRRARDDRNGRATQRPTALRRETLHAVLVLF